MVIVDDGDNSTLGTIYAVQFFDVFRIPPYSIELVMASPTCYVGDYVNAALTVRNLATWTTNVRQNLNSFNQTYVNHSGGAQQNQLAGHHYGISGWSLIHLQSDHAGGSRFGTERKLDDGNARQFWRLLDDANGGATIWHTAVVNATNPITVYRKCLRLPPGPALPAAEAGLRGEYYHITPVNASPPMPVGDPITTIIDPNVGYNWGNQLARSRYYQYRLPCGSVERLRNP